MVFKVGQWVVVKPDVDYWPAEHEHNRGPFKIKKVFKEGDKVLWYILDAPNNAYPKDLTLYKPQVGDKVKILKPTCGMLPGSEWDFTGQVGTITHLKYPTSSFATIAIDSWLYNDIEGTTYELVEPKGSINIATLKAPSKPAERPTKRVLNDPV
jgi:hypothetical protein